MPPSEQVRDRPDLVMAPGPIACENALFSILDERIGQLGEAILERPIWIVVPSISLRSHLLSQLVRRRGRSFAGLGCWTLHGIASEIVERAGRPAASVGGLLPILVRRFADDEGPLRESLDHLADGYDTVVVSVRDLLDAGLAAGHEEALLEVLVEEGSRISDPIAIARAQSVVRVACRVVEELEERDLVYEGQLLERAAELVRFQAEIGPDPGEFLIYGFSDATGLASDLISALLERYRGQMILDLPPDISNPKRTDSGVGFVRHFRERIEAIATHSSDLEPEAVAEPEVRLVRSYGLDAECREIALRIRGFLQAGAIPERIAIVARQVEPLMSPLRTHLTRLGIPFSGIGVQGPQLPVGRQIEGFIELLRERSSCRVDRWLEIRRHGSCETPVFDLRLGLFGLGARTLEEVAALDFGPWAAKGSYALPVREGFEIDAAEDRSRLVRRSVPIPLLETLRNEASAICDSFSVWSESRPWKEHLGRLRGLGELLGWSGDSGIGAALTTIWAGLEIDIPSGFELGFDEVASLMTDALRSEGFSEMGGRGSGVQVLDVIAARSRTFDHLFLAGLNQGVFPRTIREDPLLDDRLRHCLARTGHSVLPDLPCKEIGYAEERYLFAQLIWSSPSLTLSWQYADDDGKTQTPSPLLQRLRLGKSASVEGELTAVSARHPFSLLPRPEIPALAEEVLTPYERVVRAGLRGNRSEHTFLLQLAIEAKSSGAWEPIVMEAKDQDTGSETAQELAGVRTRILNEFDQKPGRVVPPGPYFGYVGCATEDDEPRNIQPLYISTLEQLARCPWQTFLQRLLRLEVFPDPTEVLPAIGPQSIGILVHRALERLVGQQLDSGPVEFERLKQAPASPIEWPNAFDIERILRREAYRLLREMSLNWDGLAEILATLATPFIEQAKAVADTHQDPIRSIAVEVEGKLRVASRDVLFRADRVDRRGDALAAVDYKTGTRPISKAKGESYRRKSLIDAIRSGTTLQAVAYSVAGNGPEDSGEYLFLHPDLEAPEVSRLVHIRGDDQEAGAAFRAAAESLVEAWGEGTFFPRLVEPEVDREPKACTYCVVAEACLRGDSAARNRLRGWVSSTSRRADPFRRTWFMTDEDEVGGNDP